MGIRTDIRDRLITSVPRYILNEADGASTAEALYEEFRITYKHMTRQEFFRLLRDIKRIGYIDVSTMHTRTPRGPAVFRTSVRVYTVTPLGKRAVRRTALQGRKHK